MTAKRKKDRDADWQAAYEICRNHPKMKCLDAAIELMKRFPGAEVVYAFTQDRALTPYIRHVGLEDAITETGKHFAVRLHGRIFDNLHPRGLPPKRWMKQFEYATLDKPLGTFFIGDDITYWNYKEFRDYLANK